MQEKSSRKLGTALRMPVSVSDLQNARNDLNVITYDSLESVKNIEEIFDDDHPFVCIFYQKHRGNNIGHFVLITRRKKDLYEYFDSSGNLPDYIDFIFNNKFKGHIKRILRDDQTMCVNPKKYQGKSDICAKYVLLRCAMTHLCLCEFEKLIRKKTTAETDAIVNSLISIKRTDGTMF